MTTEKKEGFSKKSKEKELETTVDASMVAKVFKSHNEESPETVSEKDKMEAKKIYVGPNILGLIAYTVIEGDYPGHVKKFIVDCPEVGKLFVPLKKLAEAERNKVKKGTIEHRNYNKVQSYSLGEVKA